jgi:hypothetical protein
MKKIFLWTILVILWLCPASWAGVKFETLSVNTAIGISSTLITPTAGDAEYKREPVAALIGPVETDQIRFRTDGTDPTSSVGHLLQVGQTYVMTNGWQVRNFKAIKVTNTASVPVTVLYGPKQ